MAKPTAAILLTTVGLTRLAIWGPMNPPRMAAGNMIRKNNQSKFPKRKCWTVPMAVLKKMASRELPTTTYMGRPIPKAIRGTIKGPPPNPGLDQLHGTFFVFLGVHGRHQLPSGSGNTGQDGSLVFINFNSARGGFIDSRDFHITLEPMDIGPLKSFLVETNLL